MLQPRNAPTRIAILCAHRPPLGQQCRHLLQWLPHLSARHAASLKIRTNIFRVSLPVWVF